MKNRYFTMMLVSMMSFVAFSATVDTYRFRMRLQVPRIYNNTESLGYRKYQNQRIDGYLQFVYNDTTGKTKVRVKGLENITHKINGRRITYECYDYPYDGISCSISAVGNNRTGKFSGCGTRFAFTADPSYNIGEIDEDNSLILELSGVGKMRGNASKIPYRFNGFVTGQIGCGCRAYGHISPTRLYFGYLTSYVIDTAPLCGRWSATFMNRTTEPDEKEEDEED